MARDANEAVSHAAFAIFFVAPRNGTPAKGTAVNRNRGIETYTQLNTQRNNKSRQ